MPVRQQLQGVPLELHGVVPGHSPFVFEAQDLAQAQIRRQGSESRIRVVRRDLEAPVESRQELLQHAVGCPDAARPGQPEFRDQPVLEGSRRSLHSTLRLGRHGENHLYTQFPHGPAELGRHPREPGAGRVPEDRVPVGVKGDGCAEMLHETLDQHEVVASSTASSSVNGGAWSPSHRW